MSRRYRIGESDAVGGESLVTTDGQIISTLDELTEVDGATEDNEDADDQEDDDDRAGVP